jgi:PIN domain nuclease of toxin-antitoxin system
MLVSDGAAGCVLDASALMAYIDEEPGSDVVERLLEGAVISSVNWCEAYGKMRTRGVESGGATSNMSETGVEIHAFHGSDALVAGELSLATRRFGLSLADRACLALASRLGVPAVTADRAWLDLDVGVEIVCIR